MSARFNKPIAALAITVMLLSLASANAQKVHAVDSGAKIDIFTQKDVYSGSGMNVSSDTFAPGDLVIIHGLVTHNEAPLVNMLVTFYVESPDNSSFYLEGPTNLSGIATANFTIPYKCDNAAEVFGEWTILGNAEIDDVTYQDTLTFRVDWIVKVLSVLTLDENLTYREFFGVRGDVGVEVTLRSIAMVPKNATLAITVQDESLVPTASFTVNDFIVPPNERTVAVYFRLSLPKWSRVGQATVFADALTAPAEQGGVPYCPEVSTQFYITIQNPLVIAFHDASVVQVVPSDTLVKQGQPVEITVVVRNEGTEFEDFQVNTLYNSTVIGTGNVSELAPYSAVTFTFAFDTSDVSVGNYTISGFIPYIVDEADLADNLFSDGVIQVKAAREYYLTVNTDPLDIVAISGQGWYDEGSNVSLNATGIVSGETGVRYTFSHWDVDGASMLGNLITVTMNANHTATAQYTLQYYLAVSSPYGTTGGEGWYDANSNAYATLDNGMVDYSSRTRRLFVSWGGDASGVLFMQSNGVYMDTPKTAVAEWKTQHYLSVTVLPAEITTISGEGWYDELTNATLTASQVLGYNFVYWDIDGVSQDSQTASITVLMDAPHNATANYNAGIAGWYPPYWFYWTFPFILIPLLLLIILLYRRRRKQESETLYAGWTAAYYV